MFRRAVKIVLLLALSVIPAPVAAQSDLSTVVTGTLILQWGDAYQNGSLVANRIEGTVATDDGRLVPIDLGTYLASSQYSLLELQGQRVEVAVKPAISENAAPAVQYINTQPAVNGRAPVRGSHPWLVLLCAAPDSAVSHPSPDTFYRGMLGGDYGGLDHYWRELSGGVANILGSRPLGWLTMPNSGNYYAEAYGGGWRLNMKRSTDDCMGTADPHVDFSPYDGVVILLPLPADKLNGTIWAFGGGMWLNRDGPGRYIRAAWIPVEIGTGAGNAREVPVSLLAHEMGHGFGLPHSSGPYGQVYDSRWDVMSGAFGVCSPEPAYGCPSQHTIGFHKDLVGWIPDGRKVVIQPGTAKLVELMRLALPRPGGYLLAQIPLEDSSHFYTVEARRFSGYDYRGLVPGEAIIIHEVDRTRAEPAHVIDADGNGDVNDEGAMWRTGEIFTGRNGVTVCVAGSTASGFIVGIGNGQTPQCELAADLSNSSTFASNTLPNAGQKVTLYTDLVNMHMTAQSVTVSSTVPAGSTYITGSAQTSQGVVELTPSGQLVFSVGALRDGAPARLSYVIRVDKSVRDATVINAQSTAAWTGGSLPLTHTLIANAERVNLPLTTK